MNNRQLKDTQAHFVAFWNDCTFKGLMTSNLKQVQL